MNVARLHTARKSVLDFGDIERLAPKLGKTDAPCPFCAATRSPLGARRRVMRIWRDDAHFAGFHCARCGESGWVRRNGAKAARPSPERLARIKDAIAIREA